MSMTIDIRQAVTVLNLILARVAAPKPFMQAVGQYEASKAIHRILELKQDPADTAWAPWKASTRASREAKGNVGQGLLWDTGELLHSFEIHAGMDEVEIGTPTEYGGYLQSGTEHMAARPFLGWDDRDFPALEAMLVAHLEGV